MDNEDARLSRRKDQDLIRALDARLEKARPGDDHPGQARYLGKIIDGGHMPTTVPGFYLTDPMTVRQDTPESEGATVNVDASGGKVPVLILGKRPEVGDLVPARLLEQGFWGARMGGYGTDECGHCRPPNAALKCTFTYWSRPWMGVAYYAPRTVDLTLNYNALPQFTARQIPTQGLILPPGSPLTAADLPSGAPTHWDMVPIVPGDINPDPDDMGQRYAGVLLPYDNPYWVPRHQPVHYLSLICHKGRMWLVHGVESFYQSPYGAGQVSGRFETCRIATVESCSPLALSFSATPDAWYYRCRIPGNDVVKYGFLLGAQGPSSFFPQDPRTWADAPWGEISFGVTVL